MKALPSSPPRQRDLCFRCLKPTVTCYCHALRPVSSQTLDLILLQHPAERRKTVGTARMAHLCIQNSRLIMGRSFQDNVQVNALIADPARACVILFPGRESQDIGASGWLPPTKRRLTLFVVDGTWLTARAMLRESPNLMALPQIRFTPAHRSEYKFRQQPEAHCLSTIEAVHTLLGILEPETDGSNLLELFRSMVGAQIQYAAHNQMRRFDFSQQAALESEIQNR